MRVDVGQTIKAKPGDVILVKARLPRSFPKGRHTYISVWSRMSGYDFSPHVQIEAMGFVKNGKPSMVPPMRITITDTLPKREISFIADEALEFQLRQEVDVPDDPRVKAKLKRYSEKRFRINRRIRNFLLAFTSLFRAKGMVKQ